MAAGKSTLLRLPARVGLEATADRRIQEISGVNGGTIARALAAGMTEFLGASLAICGPHVGPVRLAAFARRAADHDAGG